jgi:glucose-1-phosphate cytidylyltransferase
MKHYDHFGVTDFVLCLGYLGEKIRDYFLKYHAHRGDAQVIVSEGRVATLGQAEVEEWTVTLAETGLDTGTGGRIKRIERYIEGDTFLATYGDSLSDVPIDKVIDHHRRMGRVATVSSMHPQIRFGVLTIRDGLAIDFAEKPEAKAEWINGGFFVFDRRVFDYVDEDCTLEQKPLKRLARDGQLAVYQHEGVHRCMDTYRDWVSLNAEWESGKPAWRVW